MRDTDNSLADVEETVSGWLTGHGREQNSRRKEDVTLHTERLVREKELFYDLPADKQL